MAKLKYINFEHVGLVIFETTVNHDVMKQLVGHKAISAGFCSLPSNDELGNEPHCFGKSTSLGLVSSEKDTERLKMLLQPDGA